MIRHYIILSSSYKLGKRIAIDIPIEDGKELNLVIESIKTIQDKCGDDVSYSTHTVVTETASWSDVIRADTFFEDVKLLGTLKEFISIVQEDRTLKGIDVAKYVMTKLSCTHLKLEKMVYMCYADYICKTGDKLFNDSIYAFQYGPVIESVYYRYRGQLEKLKDDDSEIPQDKKLKLSARSRILFAENGVEKLKSIDESIERYGSESASALVDLTHRKGSPWERSYNKGFRDVITDPTILMYHYVERI